ncbi:hypothetical protein QTI24_31310 [Variovorax sp. J22P240]|uniref:hypothetical protein n=1 Tax=Variovorax sp. J22P240 TaxID=3053514 RepID=UPI0025763C70|nr:hypothetical protein [Variovorax sp. J22P240]MDM0003103.1 hypothetical protein [Variovorax sp. J22P240]
MAIKAEGKGDVDANGGSAAWWGWPVQHWLWPAVAAQKLHLPINPGRSLFSAIHNNSSVPSIERDMLAEHSYDRQRGRLALSTLAERLPASAKPHWRIADLGIFVRDVDRIKRHPRLRWLECLRNEIKELRRDDPHVHQPLRARFRR